MSSAKIIDCEGDFVFLGAVKIEVGTMWPTTLRNSAEWRVNMITMITDAEFGTVIRAAYIILSNDRFASKNLTETCTLRFDAPFAAKMRPATKTYNVFPTRFGAGNSNTNVLPIQPHHASASTPATELDVEAAREFVAHFPALTVNPPAGKRASASASAASAAVPPVQKRLKPMFKTPAQIAHARRVKATRDERTALVSKWVDSVFARHEQEQTEKREAEEDAAAGELPAEVAA